MATIKSYSPRPLFSGSEPLNGSYAMKRKHALVIAMLLVLPLLALAQDDDDGKPRTFGVYTVQQSVELGGHITGVDGNPATYNTFTDIHSGPRVLGQSLYMTASPDSAVLFDTLSLESFGFGGDPEDLARVRVKKQKLYNFVALYRRDKNFWDFNLFANPVANNNTFGLTNSFGQVSPFLANSPHEQITTRNMGDFSLTLFPQSKVSFRLGYARTNNAGAIDSSLHESNEIDLVSQTRLRNDRYQAGVDFKPIDRTTISFDEYYERDHLNYNWVDNPFGGFFLNGTQVDPGIALQPNANMVTASCVVSGALGYTNGGTINPKCNNGVYFYNRFDVVRTGIPTEQLSLQSNYFRKLDITADGLYSSATSNLGNYNDVWSGIGTHSGVRVYQITGPAQAKRITNNADLGLTYHFSPSWSVSDTFRYVNWREPGIATQTEFNCFPSVSPALLTTGIGSPCGLSSLIGGLPGPGLTGTTVPTSISGTPASPNFGNPFASLSPFLQFLGERSFFNTVRPKWQPSRRVSIYVGYRYAHRNLRELDGTGVTENVPLTAPTTSSTALTPVPPNAQLVPATFIAANTFLDSLDEHRALFGTLLRPADAWRINADAELAYANNAFTNISPRHEQRVRLNSSYKLVRWATLNGAVHFVESRNDFATNVVGINAMGATVPAANLFPTGYIPAYGHKDHYRYYTAGAAITPNSRLSFDFGWTYQDQHILSASCLPMVSGLTPINIGGVASPLAAPGLCPTVQFTLAGTPVAAGEPSVTGGLPSILNYQENTQSVFANLSVKPVKRVTLRAGYDLTSDSGSNLWIRGDNGQPLLFQVDPCFNIVAPGGPASPLCPVAGPLSIAAGPNPLVPSGTQAFNWNKPHAGVEVAIARGVAFNGLWSYYAYHEQNAFVGAALADALVPRNFHANVGTVSLKYSF